MEHLALHGLLEKAIFQVFEEAEIRPVGWQGFCDVKATGMRDEPVVFYSNLPKHSIW
jgi:hypothetical protein